MCGVMRATMTIGAIRAPPVGDMLMFCLIFSGLRIGIQVDMVVMLSGGEPVGRSTLPEARERTC